MGLIDALQPETTVTIKLTELSNLIRESAKAEFMENCIKCDVPHEHAEAMITGKKRKEETELQLTEKTINKESHLPKETTNEETKTPKESNNKLCARCYNGIKDKTDECSNCYAFNNFIPFAVPEDTEEKETNGND